MFGLDPCLDAGPDFRIGLMAALGKLQGGLDVFKGVGPILTDAKPPFDNIPGDDFPGRRCTRA